MLRKLAGINSTESTPRFISKDSARRLKGESIIELSPRTRNYMRRSFDGELKRYKSNPDDSPRDYTYDRTKPYASTNTPYIRRSVYPRAPQTVDRRQPLGSSSNEVLEKFMKYETHQKSIELLTKRMDLLDKRLKTQEVVFSRAESERHKYAEQFRETLIALEQSVRMNKDMMLKIIKNLRENLMEEVRSTSEKILLPVSEDLAFLKKRTRDVSELQIRLNRNQQSSTSSFQQKLDHLGRYIDSQVESTKKNFEHSLNENLKLITDLTSNLKYLLNSKLQFISLETTNAIKEMNVVSSERFHLNRVQCKKDVQLLRQELSSRLSQEIKLMGSQIRESRDTCKKRNWDLQTTQKQIFLRLDKEAQFSHLLNQYQYEQKTETAKKLRNLRKRFLSTLASQHVVSDIMSSVYNRIEHQSIAYSINRSSKRNLEDFTNLSKSHRLSEQVLNRKLEEVRDEQRRLDLRLKNTKRKEKEKRDQLVVSNVMESVLHRVENNDRFRWYDGRIRESKQETREGYKDLGGQVDRVSQDVEGLKKKNEEQISGIMETLSRSEVLQEEKLVQKFEERIQESQQVQESKFEGKLQNLEIEQQKSFQEQLQDTKTQISKRIDESEQSSKSLMASQASQDKREVDVRFQSLEKTIGELRKLEEDTKKRVFGSKEKTDDSSPSMVDRIIELEGSVADVKHQGESKLEYLKSEIEKQMKELEIHASPRLLSDNDTPREKPKEEEEEETEGEDEEKTLVIPEEEEEEEKEEGGKSEEPEEEVETVKTEEEKEEMKVMVDDVDEEKEKKGEIIVREDPLDKESEFKHVYTPEQPKEEDVVEMKVDGEEEDKSEIIKPEIGEEKEQEDVVKEEIVEEVKEKEKEEEVEKENKPVEEEEEEKEEKEEEVNEEKKEESEVSKEEKEETKEEVTESAELKTEELEKETPPIETNLKEEENAGEEKEKENEESNPPKEEEKKEEPKKEEKKEESKEETKDEKEEEKEEEEKVIEKEKDDSTTVSPPINLEYEIIEEEKAKEEIDPKTQQQQQEIPKEEEKDDDEEEEEDEEERRMLEEEEEDIRRRLQELGRENEEEGEGEAEGEYYDEEEGEQSGEYYEEGEEEGEYYEEEEEEKGEKQVEKVGEREVVLE